MYCVVFNAKLHESLRCTWIGLSYMYKYMKVVRHSKVIFDVFQKKASPYRCLRKFSNGEVTYGYICIEHTHAHTRTCALSLLHTRAHTQSLARVQSVIYTHWHKCKDTHAWTRWNSGWWTEKTIYTYIHIQCGDCFSLLLLETVI